MKLATRTLFFFTKFMSQPLKLTPVFFDLLVGLGLCGTSKILLITSTDKRSFICVTKFWKINHIGAFDT